MIYNNCKGTKKPRTFIGYMDWRGAYNMAINNLLYRKGPPCKRGELMYPKTANYDTFTIL